MKMHWLCLPLLLAATPAAAQVVSGTVEGARGVVPHAVVTILDREGTQIASTLADVGGRFTLPLPVGGLYRLRVIGDDH